MSENGKMTKSMKNIKKYFKRNGKGVYTWPDGDRYEGGFLDDEVIFLKTKILDAWCWNL